MVQKVIQEKTEKLANIEYDRVIKKEFGKPKSITKRTCFLYKNGDSEFNKEVEKPVLIEKEKSKEEIELEEKMKYLEGDFLGLFKVQYKKNATFTNGAHFFFAENKEDVYKEMEISIKKFNAENKADIDIKDVKNKISSITRMLTSNIKTEKEGLKHLSKYTVEEIKEMYNKVKEIKEKERKNAIKKIDEMLESGFVLYAGKLLGKNGKSLTTFLNFAKNKDEAKAMFLAERRIKDFSNKIGGSVGFSIGTIEDITDKENGNKIENDGNTIMGLVDFLCDKKDKICQFLFSNTTVLQYEKEIKESLQLLEAIKSGDKEKILKIKTQKILGEVGDLDFIVDKIAQLDKTSALGGKVAIRNLLEKILD